MKNDAVIKVHNLSKAFGNNQVLSGLDLELEKNSNTVLLGKSGSGKSVLIKCIVKLIQKDSGTITIFETDSDDCTEHEFNQLRVRIGFLFQNAALYDSLSVRQNLEFPLIRQNRKIKKAELKERVAEALENVGLPDTGDKMPAELSGGMKKRIGLARTLIMQPEIMLYDEPTTGLDPVSSREISELILETQQKYKVTSLIITHDIKCAEITADRVVMLKDGSLFKDGTYQEISKDPDSWTRSFFK